MKHWKHTIAILLALCLIWGGTALAQDEWRLCSPEEVDVSDVQEINGRLVGEIVLPESAGHIRLMVDCPVPEPFTAQQQSMLTVRYQEVTKGDLSAAIEAAGQSVKGGKLAQYFNGDSLNRHVSFSRDGEDCNFSVYERFARDLSGHPNQREMEASVALARELMERLGAGISEDFLYARRNTVPEQLAGTFSLTGNSCAPELYSLIEKEHARNGGADDKTLIRGCYELLGLPVMDQYYWEDGGDRYGAKSGFACVVRDDGTLAALAVEGMPVVEEAEPMALPQRTWQETLQLWAANAFWPMSTLNEAVEKNTLYGEIVHYPSYEVLTDLRPCWVGREAYRLEPGWCYRTETRVVSDDSLDGIGFGYCAVSDMRRVN